PKRLRFVENDEAVELLVKKYDFEIVDTDELSAVEQVKLFSRASFVIGIHGAGLTNLMFAQQPEKLIELFPSPDTGYLPFHYIMIASLKGMVYDALIGLPSENKFSGGFLVDVIELEKLIKK
ncbi:MAG: glycosyltransferase family 61 protein, partial [Cyclobacteriaceae bacterium]|nr:glycosyltransferase family 61 protein [Cyclobacteriaceae bacterium]